MSTDLFHDINGLLLERGLKRLEEMLRPAAMSGLISDLLTASLANHSRSLTENGYFNGHPDLIVAGFYPNDRVQAGAEGIEIKSTRKKGGAVDTHGAREQWMCVFVYEVDTETEPARDRRPMSFTEVYLAHVGVDDFRTNLRGGVGDTNRDPAPKRPQEASRTLGLQGLKQLGLFPLVVRQSRDRLARDSEVFGITLDADTPVAHCLGGRHRRACPAEWIENNALAKRQYASDQLSQEA